MDRRGVIVVSSGPDDSLGVVTKFFYTWRRNMFGLS